MRTLNIVFEDKDYKRLEIAKKDQNWRDFILGLLESMEVRK